MSSSALRREAIPAAATIFCKRCSLRSLSGVMVIPDARVAALQAPLRWFVLLRVLRWFALLWVPDQPALLWFPDRHAELLEHAALPQHRVGNQGQLRPRPGCPRPALRPQLQTQPVRRPSFRTPPCWADRSHLSAQTGAETPWW